MGIRAEGRRGVKGSKRGATFLMSRLFSDPSERRSSAAQSLGKEGKDLVARGDGGLAGFVDQVLRDDAVGAGHALGEERRHIRVRGAVWKHAADEAVAESLGVGGEALSRAEAVTFKP